MGNSDHVDERGLSIGRIAELACLLEVTAAKPGNVHRAADFEDTTFEDFLTSAVVLGQVIDRFAARSVGQTVLAAVQQTRELVGSNTNLGMILLIVPMAKSLALGSLNQQHVRQILESLGPTDARDVYEAIRIARPGGLGSVPELDVGVPSVAPSSLLDGMRLARERDFIARQYANGFEEVFQIGLPKLVEARARFDTLSQAIVFTHVAMMSQFADSLIARKCGAEVAEHSRMLASQAVEKLPATDGGAAEMEAFWARVGELDFWLRSDGHRRNPGTTADLIAASLFAAIQSGKLQPPFK